MKKIIRRVGALSLAAAVLAGSSMVTCATERTYTYNYDYWEDVQDSPDAYTVTRVFASVDLAGCQYEESAGTLCEGQHSLHL